MVQELLFGDLANGNNGMDEMSRSYTIQDSGSSMRSSLIPLARVPSAPGSLKDQKWVMNIYFAFLISIWTEGFVSVDICCVCLLHGICILGWFIDVWDIL